MIHDTDYQAYQLCLFFVSWCHGVRRLLCLGIKLDRSWREMYVRRFCFPICTTEISWDQIFFFFSWSNKHYFTKDFWAFNFHECYMKKGRGKNSLNTSMDTICWQKDATHLKWVHIQSKLFAFWFKVSVLSFVTVILPCFQSLLKSRRITRECSCWKSYTPFSRWQNHKILGGVFSPGFFFFSFTKAMKYWNYFTLFVEIHCADHNLVIAGIYEIWCGRWKHCQHTLSDLPPLLLPQICYWFSKEEWR